MDSAQHDAEQHVNLSELRSQSLSVVSLAFAVLAYAWLLVLSARFDRYTRPELWAGAVALAMAAPLTYTMRDRWGVWAARLLVVVVFGSTTCLVRTLPMPHMAYLYLPIVVLASVLLGQRSLLFITCAAVAIVVGIELAEQPQFAWSLGLWFPPTIIASASVAGWLSARSLSMALTWTLRGYEQARERESELRERRAELLRALQALEEASSRLQRTNRELLFARQQAEEARLVEDQFVANVSHELRTPLNLLIGFAEMMYLSPESYRGVRWSPELQSDVGEMYRASRHLQSLVDDILDLSRIDSGRLPLFRQMADIGPIIMDAVEAVKPLLKSRGLNCQVEWPDTPLPALFVDRGRIRQVLLNLLNNAMRFTDKGGITVRLEAADGATVVGIHDTGIGIPNDQLERIFEKFRQVDGGSAQRGGAGLGLALSRQFIELHGGRMWVESQIGSGSSFYFSLPLSEEVPQSPRLQRTVDRRRADLSTAPLIIVDPDPMLGQMLSRYLGDRRVITVADPSAVKEIVELEHPLALIANLSPDAPPDQWVGLAGDAADRYRIPVFRCSIPSSSWLQSAMDIEDLLIKPVLREALDRAVRRISDRPLKVLIVDDNPGFVSLVSRMLRTNSLAREVITAYSGEEALRLAREHVPELILLDLVMPGLDGFGVLRELRREKALAEIPVIAVTATSYAEEVLQRRGGNFTLTQSGGLGAGVLTELLRSALQIVTPDYASGAKTSASA